MSARPYCVFSAEGSAPRVGARSGDGVLDLAEALGDPVFAAPTLNPFMAQGPAAWREVRAAVAGLSGPVVPLAEVRLHRPFEVADFVDYYSSLEHATNCGRILRPGSAPLSANWREIPVGYHGRSGTVLASGTPIVRPSGVRAGEPCPTFGPSVKLDVEVEVGFVVGVPSTLGRPVPIGDFAAYVFGAVILLDWSARDIQSFEQQPLGPNLGKSFATTIGPWVVPLAALDGALVEPPRADPPPLPHLRPTGPSGYDIRLQFAVNGRVISRPRFASMYWTPAQQFAHLTSNGASLRTGDLLGSGTVSSFDPGAQGCLLELTADGREPLRLADGTQLGYLADGDRVTVSASAPGADGPIDFGVAEATVLPAL
jgi:fumarylacetoacetase